MPITVDGFGVGGVNVDNDILDLQDNETASCQNAVIRNTQARANALIKRPGLTKINSQTLGAPILGGAEAPFATSGSAPFLGNPGGALPPGGGGLFNATTTALFNGKRVIVIGYADNLGTATGTQLQTAGGAGWLVTSEGFADPAIVVSSEPVWPVVTSPRPPIYDAAHPLGSTTAAMTTGEPHCAVVNGILYFPENVYNGAGSTPIAILPAVPLQPQLRSIDGYVDNFLGAIPPNTALINSLAPTGAGAQYQYYIDCIAPSVGDSTTLLISVFDRIDHSGTILNGRVFSYNIPAGVFSEVYNSVAGTSNDVHVGVPFTLQSFLSRPWMGAVTDADAHPYYASLQTLATAYDGKTVTNVTQVSGAEISGLTSSQTFNGSLYFGTVMRTHSGANAFAQVVKVPADTSVAPTVALTATGVGPNEWNSFVSLRAFSGSLFASWYGAGETKIYQSVDGANWNTVYDTTGAGQTVPLFLFADPDGAPTHLYAVGSDGNVASGSARRYLSSTDGITYTDQSANFASGATHMMPINVLLGFDQHAAPPNTSLAVIIPAGFTVQGTLGSWISDGKGSWVPNPLGGSQQPPSGSTLEQSQAALRNFDKFAELNLIHLPPGASFGVDYRDQNV